MAPHGWALKRVVLARHTEWYASYEQVGPIHNALMNMTTEYVRVQIAIPWCAVTTGGNGYWRKVLFMRVVFWSTEDWAKLESGSMYSPDFTTQLRVSFPGYGVGIWEWGLVFSPLCEHAYHTSNPLWCGISQIREEGVWVESLVGLGEGMAECTVQCLGQTPRVMLHVCVCACVWCGGVCVCVCVWCGGVCVCVCGGGGGGGGEYMWMCGHEWRLHNLVLRPLPAFYCLQYSLQKAGPFWKLESAILVLQIIWISSKRNHSVNWLKPSLTYTQVTHMHTCPLHSLCKHAVTHHTLHTLTLSPWTPRPCVCPPSSATGLQSCLLSCQTAWPATLHWTVNRTTRVHSTLLTIKN